VIHLPEAFSQLLSSAIHAAQQSGDLPVMDVPTIVVQPSKKADQGDYSSPVALGLAKGAGMKPRDVAERIVKHLPTSDLVEKVDIAGPGFINFFLAESYVRGITETILAEGAAFGTLTLGNGKRAQVEFVSANPTGPLTIGRSRGAIVGDTMARLLEAAGYDVQREYYFNNAGNQMVNLGNSLRYRYLEQLGEPLPEIDNESFYRGAYLVDYAKDLVAEVGKSLVGKDWQPFKEYAEKRMFQWIRQTLDSVAIRHDEFFNEDSLFTTGAAWQVLEELKARGYIYTDSIWAGASDEERAKNTNKEPAQFFRSSDFGDSEDRVLLKNDGTPTYTLPDIAYHKNKIERGFDLLVNVLGADHLVQYQVVAAGIKALGMDASKIRVVIIQMVLFEKDGQVQKGSTRKGIYDTLDEMVEEVGADAIRYHLLARSPSAQMTFNINEVVKQSNDNPVFYIQNAHVRCAGILREAEARSFTDEGADLAFLGADELAFLKKTNELPEIIQTAVQEYEPHKIAFFALELAGIFHPLYDRVRVLHSEVPEEVAKARLHFYKAAKVVFARVLTLMGMTTPERM
jgi:arginyl-tRNA synthetase